MEEFEDQVPPTTRFSVGYFEGRQSTKKWMVTKEDLNAMYSTMELAHRTEILLWCNGFDSESDDKSKKKRKRDSSPAPLSKRAEKEKDIDDLVTELKEMHSGDNYTDPQLRLWARMIINGLHTSKETPPQVPMITGITPTKTRAKSVEDTVFNTVTAVIKAMGPNSTNVGPLIQQNFSPLSSGDPTATAAVSPSKAVDMRGKCFAQLASLKQLFDDSVITEEELQEQKGCILQTLRKLS